MRMEPLGQTHLLKALPLTRIRWCYRAGFNLCLRGPLTSGHSRYPERSFDYWKQKAWITDHKGHTNQRLTSLPPSFIKPEMTDWLDPKDRHWPIQNKESPCLMPPPFHGIFMSYMTTVIVLDLNISPKMLRYWNFIFALVEWVTERQVNEEGLDPSGHLSWIDAYNGIPKKWEDPPCLQVLSFVCLSASLLP